MVIIVVKYSKLFSSLILVIALILYSGIVDASKQNINNYYLNLSQLQGRLDYQIQGIAVDENKWKSLLQFPIDNTMLTAQYSTTLFKPINAGIKISKSITTEKTGKFEDTDWLSWVAGTNDKDIYAIADTDAQVLKTEFNLQGKWHNYRNLNYTWQIGYNQQKYNFIVYDANVLYDKTYDSVHNYKLSGPVITYQANYRLPYLGVKWKRKNEGKLIYRGSINYAPHVDFEDIDNHLLRYKESVAKATGDALLGQVGFDYHYTTNFDIFLNLSYIKIDVAGLQNQYWYDNGDAPQGTAYKNIGYQSQLETIDLIGGFNYKF